MKYLTQINAVTAALVCVCLFPIITGAFGYFSRERIQYSLGSLLDNIEFLLGLLLAIFLTKKIFFENSTGVFKKIYEWIPTNLRSILYGHDVLTYICAVPVILLLVLIVLRFLTAPIYRAVVVPLSNRLYLMLNSTNSILKRFIGALWKIPKSVYMVFIFGLLLNFYSYYFPSPMLTKWMNESTVYQALYKNALYPVLNSNIAKQIPVIINDSFKRTSVPVLPGEEGQDGPSAAAQLAQLLKDRNIRVTEYFNGVTLDEAVKSSPEIDQTAKKIVGNETSSKKKAELIYKWITGNVKYDNEKAAKISSDPKGISSGSIAAFNTRKGICFDYSCLYISMCRAVGLKVRLVTGLGYSGISWGDHAWNQVFVPEEDRWVNVDTTFGTIADYFDKPDFDVDHKYAEVQGEW